MKKRKYLTHHEVSRLLSAARCSGHSVRNSCMVLMAYLHGLRISELLSLRISDMELTERKLYVRRLKNGFSTVHPLLKAEVKIIREWLGVRESMLCRTGEDCDWLFISRTGRPLSRQQFYNILVAAGKTAELNVPVHPHMLRHACGYSLADNGADTRLIQDYLGHRNIRHTVVYTASNSGRFRGLWKRHRKEMKATISTKVSTTYCSRF
ncbi:tyrosine-type recombinase/integrase [Salmonella enterica]|uniref:Tyrosine-type recombinase/integrase n=1 Tax=Salmonella enterica TaxID=28901 RepID=A0A5U6SXU4_SALER|nr:tyrosine-type recombinase/integrase [Salmonella enterica]EDQ9732025.1 tyrosine-type recombinase/integrase [Salmonella enterica subsp. enterica]EDC2358330.1 tyrosine-type recombinase/integrase [Salmonella enterica]EHY0219194.1 tyrosine-type recombinase/integrase [Salmonella enterica]EJT7259159.1 tyrosine-type recombinase/integrase [Salmonella enterica]